MTLRTLLVLFGGAMFFPALVFLMAYRPGDAPKWASRALRALALIPCLDGFRLMTVNLLRLDKPLMYENWFDQVVQLGTIIGGLAAICFSFSFYINVRKWQ